MYGTACAELLYTCVASVQYRRWYCVSVTLPALTPGIDVCHYILNCNKCATGRSVYCAHKVETGTDESADSVTYKK